MEAAGHATIVIHSHNNRATSWGGLYFDPGLCPLTGIAKKIAQHFCQIFLLAANEMPRRHIHLNCKTASSVDAKQGTREPYGGQDRTASAWHIAGTSGAGMKQMKFNLPVQCLLLKARSRRAIPLTMPRRQSAD
jgi:hypothetical protein